MRKKDLNFIFWGTPDVASETLEILKENGYIPSLVITAPDKPQGRKMLITPPPVKLWANENNIPYLQPEDLKIGQNVVFKSIAQADEPSIANFQQKIMCSFKNNILPDLFIVVAYGKIIPEEIINMPKLGSINIHYSLLPKYRGASPVESAILNGDTETGITIQKMEYKMDTGPIISHKKIEIKSDEKAGDLRKRLIKIGGNLLVKTLPNFIDGKINLISQNESEATYCKKIKKENGEINLNDDPIKNYNKFRAYATWPRTFFFKEGKRIIITDAVLENNLFVIKKIIPEGEKETEYKK
ncbi:MAG: Methionyl-tRNA formyltransferase [Candidatus Nomurabacteria bacterium GW2011_GWE1_32_28]|uniref:Methionyl-tRNA formyltransferase n=1 Tax=Candidatus Nomurabacteria bacterium GW2011_GWF1_31_48 TaxID=1618767 RepID=A0A0F9YUK6_9BACT|nr:MAG: Methionyl-tRNA formyltransferase [Candidatus Nomurabacteria bacterium GW2011_GWF2_30_133]KKP28531.1 MAG: Methionyl-tRNA formyltransferase [Candidatus Nomurabacteria bacterium GW2011_GWE2_31_40]KKP30126.1 MAG: Methionyl-tRNA formyltransferase [Candidatus Nomurabacteria bacterium GW2011_GWF1_31_48]KKP34671.1 MAG: Methionyl-tRNA formyltransferase [Candidatus Nomurabacteria bacterium GW2011_GWE1_32_28]HAS80868.1 methionyl-tRNA formyltransferase [Candidatus Nomurabacteria bacterium]